MACARPPAVAEARLRAKLHQSYRGISPLSPYWLTWSLVGGVAQLAERYVRNVEAVGSNPITST
jgi:hypothetical protein